MNKKIASEVAIVIIAIVAIIIGGLFWFSQKTQENKEVAQKEDTIQVAKNGNNVGNISSNDATKKIVLNQDSNGWWIHQDGEIGMKFSYPTKLNVEEIGWDSSGKLYSWETGENVITTQKIEYDNSYAEEATLYEPNQFSQDSATKLFANPSCDALSKIIENFSYDDKYKTLLPSSFKKPNICGYSKENGILKFYVIGLRNDTEGTPHMGSDIVVLTDKYAILITDTLDLGNNIPKAERYKKTHPNIQFGSKEDLALRKIYEDEITTQIIKPGKDLTQKFDTLSKIAKSISISN